MQRKFSKRLCLWVQPLFFWQEDRKHKGKEASFWLDITGRRQNAAGPKTVEEGLQKLAMGPVNDSVKLVTQPMTSRSPLRAGPIPYQRDQNQQRGGWRSNSTTGWKPSNA